MKLTMKNLLIICMMTIFYTIVITFIFPQTRSYMLDSASKLSEDFGKGLSSAFRRFLQVETNSGSLNASVPNIKKLKIDFIPTYYIKASLDEDRYEINGQMKLSIDNPETNSIVFYTYPYAWSPMIIEKVLLNEEEVTFSYNQKQLTIENPTEEKILNFTIKFMTPVPQKGTRFGYKDDVWLITTWYPMLGVLDKNKNWIDRPDPIGMGDPYLFNYADYVVEWTSSPSIKWLSTGTLLSETTIDNKRKTTWKVNNVRNFALAGSENYQVKILQFGKVTFSIALTDQDKFEQVIDIVNFSFPFFQTYYGQLPYSNVAIIETGHDTNFALEYPNMAVFSKDMYANNEIEHWLPHEIGHMWWYNTVGVNEIEDGWIDEGLAELSVVLYLENRYSKSEGERLRNTYRKKNWLLTNRSPYKTMDVGLYNFDNRLQFYDSWYARSADMFLTLREEIGENKFQNFISTLYQKNIGKTITEDNIILVLNESLNTKTELFQNWIHEAYQQTKWDVKITNSPSNFSSKSGG